MQFRRLHEGFGAEVQGFDLLAPAAPQEIDALRRAFEEHQLLVFRCGRPLAPERQVEIAGWFGAPVDEGGGQLWTVLSNEDAAGSMRLPFHSDYTYTDYPARGLSLHAIELPSAGASTSYVSGVHAWAKLRPQLKERLAAMTLRHRYDSRTIV